MGGRDGRGKGVSHDVPEIRLCGKSGLMLPVPEP